LAWNGLVPRIAGFLAAILSFGLGGCFVSTDPLISPAASDHPWAALRGQHFDWEDGKWKLHGAVSLSREGAYYVLKSDDSDEAMRFLLHHIGPDRYIAQAEDLSDKAHPTYVYGLIVVEGNRIYEYGFDDQSSQCGVPGIDPPALHLRPSDDGCGVTSLDALTTIFRALMKAHPEAETRYDIQS
jgi:hypothetical protein